MKFHVYESLNEIPKYRKHESIFECGGTMQSGNERRRRYTKCEKHGILNNTISIQNGILLLD